VLLVCSIIYSFLLDRTRTHHTRYEAIVFIIIIIILFCSVHRSRCNHCYCLTAITLARAHTHTLIRTHRCKYVTSRHNHRTRTLLSSLLLLLLSSLYYVIIIIVVVHFVRAPFNKSLDFLLIISSKSYRPLM